MIIIYYSNSIYNNLFHNNGDGGSGAGSIFALIFLIFHFNQGPLTTGDEILYKLYDLINTLSDIIYVCINLYYHINHI